MTAPARGRRLEPDARREEILDHASRLFGERAYGAVSTTELAETAGVARGLINHYFGTKRALFLEAVQRLLEIPEDAVAELPAGTRSERAGAAVDWFLHAVERHRGLWLAVGSVGGDPDVDAIVAEADEIAVERVLAALFPGEAHPEVLRSRLRSFFGMARAASREWLLRGAVDRAQTHALLHAVLLTVTDLPRSTGE